MQIGVLWLLVWVAGIAGVLFAFDRLMLWMEKKGWVYWRRSKQGGGSGVGNALLEVQSLIEPNKRHVVEMMREEKKEQADSGAPPSPLDSEEDEVVKKG